MFIVKTKHWHKGIECGKIRCATTLFAPQRRIKICAAHTVFTWGRQERKQEGQELYLGVVSR